VNIADLHDREAIERARQIVDRHVDRHDARAAPRIDEADGRRQQREQRHRSRAIDLPLCDVNRLRRERTDDQHDEQHQLACERQHEQRRKEAERQQACPREPVAERLPFDRARDHAERNQQH
jgi:hypothetical protein